MRQYTNVKPDALHPACLACSYLPAMVLSPWLAAMYLRWQRATDQQGRKQRNLARVAAVAWLTGLSLQSTDVASRWRTRQSFW